MQNRLVGLTAGAVWVLLSFFSNALHADIDAYPEAEWHLKEKLLNNVKMRSVQALTEEASWRYRKFGTDRIYANFFHDGKFWIARVPFDPVQDVIYQKEIFPAGPFKAAHNQLRFKLKRGREIQLFPQTVDFQPSQVSLSDIVFSAQAVVPVGETYNLAAGEFGNYGLALRFMSLKERYYEMITLQNHDVSQYRLKITDAEKQGVLNFTLNRSTEAHKLRWLYNTGNDSCTTECYLAIDSVVHRSFIHAPARLLDRIPTKTVFYLWTRGLIYLDGSSFLPTLNKELAELAWSPDLLERKALELGCTAALGGPGSVPHLNDF